jgi:hypothetical protein
MALLLTLLVVLGFLFHFLATFPVSPWSTRIAWGCWFAASLLWALGNVGARAV